MGNVRKYNSDSKHANMKWVYLWVMCESNINVAEIADNEDVVAEGSKGDEAPAATADEAKP